MGHDSSVGIATLYGLDGPRDRIPVGARFASSFQTGPGAHPASYTMGTGSFPWVKRPGRGIDHPPPSSTEVKERLELYLNSPSGTSWPVLGRPLPLLSYSRVSLDKETYVTLLCESAQFLGEMKFH